MTAEDGVHSYFQDIVKEECEKEKIMPLEYEYLHWAEFAGALRGRRRVLL